MWRRLICCVGLLMLVGCAGKPSGRSQATSPVLLDAGALPAASGPRLPVRTPKFVVLLDIYHFTLPFGAVSENDEFWKRIDEDTIEVATHDLLLKNGMRIGVGHDTDWPYFKGLLAKYPAARNTRVRAEPGTEGYLDLPMRSGAPEQNIFGIDAHGVDWGRRFEKCDDFLSVSFVSSPHHPGDTVLKVCPLVRGLRQIYHVSVMNNEESQIEENYPQHLYDMRCQASVGPGDFMVLAPSAEARLLTTSLGATFLTSEGIAERMEHVLVLVPRVYRTNELPPPQEP